MTGACGKEMKCGLDTIVLPFLRLHPNLHPFQSFRFWKIPPIIGFPVIQISSMISLCIIPGENEVRVSHEVILYIAIGRIPGDRFINSAPKTQFAETISS